VAQREIGSKDFSIQASVLKSRPPTSYVLNCITACTVSFHSVKIYLMVADRSAASASSSRPFHL